MARGKKKETEQSLEERLEQALVPVEEQPYTVPENWCWVKLLETFINCTDSKKKVQKNTYLDDGLLAVVDQGQELVGGYTNDENMAYFGDLPVVIFGDHTRCIKYVDFRFAQGADGIRVLKPKTFYRPKVFYYALQELDIPNMGYRRHFPLFPQYSLPLPPLAEQQRIVDRIESLFAKLDEAKEKAQAVVDGFETRKAAILYKAFTGKLTAQWRKEKLKGENTWRSTCLSDILDVRDGTHDSPQYYDVGYPLVTSKNLKDGQIVFKDIKYISKNDFDKINERSKVDIGDILFAMIGTIGNPVVVEVEPNFAIKNMALFKNIGKVNPYFIKYYLDSQMVVDKMKKEAKGSTQKFVALGYLRSFPVCIPETMEQDEIVNTLDYLLNKEQQAKEAAETVLAQIEVMKKSILARAFRGELGTNDPTEESAVEMLKQAL